MNAALRTLASSSTRALVALALVGSVRDARAAERCAATSRDLLTAEEAALSAYGALDVDGFVSAADHIQEMLGCMVEPVTRDLAAAAHRMIGLQAFTAGDKEKAELAFAAARSLEPEWRFPESLFPPGHPVRTIYEAIPLDQAAWTPLPPTAAVVRIDGRVADARPSSWPALVQAFGVDGAVLGSWYLWPGDPLPALPAPLPLASTLPTTTETMGQLPAPKRTGPRWGWLGVAAVSAGGAGFLYGVAAKTSEAYQSDDTNPELRERLRQRTNGLLIASGAAGLVAVGGTTVAFVQVRW